MLFQGRALSRYVLFAAIAALPCVLLLSSIRTLRELDEQKQVYLRQRVAEIAGALEAEGSDPDPGPLLQREPGLRDLRAIEQDSRLGGQAKLQPIWRGQQLYLIETIDEGSGPTYRAYVPFHGPSGLRIAQIDMDGHAADFLVVHARRTVFLSVLGGLVLIALAGHAVWMAQRSAALERRQAAMEHLARLGRLSATLAHEIRNPLGTVKGFTQLAIERAANTSELLDPVLREVQRLERLVTQLLAYGRPPQPAVRSVFWPEVASELEQHVRSSARGEPIQLVVGKDPIKFVADPDLLRQILLNLLCNSLDAVAEAASPQIDVGVLVSRGRLTVTVSDNGPGISTEMAAKVFEPFFSTKAFGTGLGLAISEQLARLMQATLELHGRSPHGVEAVLTLRDANPVREQMVIADYGTNSDRR